MNSNNQPIKLTEAYLKARIKNVKYVRIPDSTVTICALETVEGFHVIGKSACLDPRNFDATIGEKVAYDDAFRQMWDLEGYHIKAVLSDSSAE